MGFTISVIDCTYSDSAPQDEPNVISFSLFSNVRHKNLFENAGPGDKWFSLKSLKITRTVINYPDLNYADPTVSKIMTYTQELLNMFVTFAVLI